MHMRDLVGDDLRDILRDEERIVFKVRAWDGELLGYIRRAYPWLGHSYGAKTLNVVTNTEAPFIHFPFNTRKHLSDSLLIVEDVPSSIKASLFTPTVALCGTELSFDDCSYFSSIGIRHLTIALDADAVSKQYKLKQKVEFMFDSVSMLHIDKDIKDMTLEEAEQSIGG